MMATYLLLALAALATSLLVFTFHRTLKGLLGQAFALATGSRASRGTRSRSYVGQTKTYATPVFDGTIRKPWGW